jgi:group I intron endonuclease
MAHDDVSGIYAIEHAVSAKFYIGSSYQCRRRKSQHWTALRGGYHPSPHLQHAWNKYGEDAFEFFILEECAKSDLLIREQVYLDAFKPIFNSCWIAGRVTSPEVNARRAESLRARAALITHCPKGHAYDAENTYISKKGNRICRQCNTERVARVYASETSEQTAARLQRNLDYHTRHRDQRLTAMRTYVTAHKDEKRAYDRARRQRLSHG